MRQTRSPDWRRPSATAPACQMGVPTHTDWHELQSEVVARARYDRDTKILVLQMTSGRSYPYAEVPESIFVGLLTADSPGSFYNRHIRGKFSAPVS